MPHFAKPAEGSWTEHYPELGTGPVSYEDSISPEHYELERDAIFRRTWLNVGRVEQLPRKGSYFTKELDAARTSVVVVRGTRRRGPGLPQHLPPPRQQAGVERLSRSEETERHLPPVHLQVPRLALRPRGRPHLRAAGGGVLRPRQGRLRPRAGAGRGVGGVHLREPRPRQHRRRSRDYLGELGRRPRGLPVRRDDPGLQVPGRGREQLEALHRRLRRVLPRTCSAREAGRGRGVPQAPGLRLRGAGLRASTARTAWSRRGAACRRRRTSTWSSRSSACCAAACSARGTSPTSAIDELPPALNPARHPAWGVDTFVFFPNFMLLVWAPNWYLTYHYWPTSYNSHIFEGTLYFVPPKTATERLQQELAAVTFKEYALQDGNTLEATQRMHRVAGRHRVPAERPGDPAPPPAQDRPRPRRRAPGRQPRPPSASRRRPDEETPMPAPSPPTSPTSSRSPTGASRPRPSATPSGCQLHGRDAGVLRRRLPRLEDGHGLPRRARRSTPCPRTPRRLLWLCYSLVNVSFPVEVWRQPRVPDSGAASMDVVVEPAV